MGWEEGNSSAAPELAVAVQESMVDILGLEMALCSSWVKGSKMNWVPHLEEYNGAHSLATPKLIPQKISFENPSDVHSDIGAMWLAFSPS